MSDRKTRLVRIPADIAEKLEDIKDVTGEAVSDQIDPLLRDAVEAKHTELKTAIKAIKSARAKHRPAAIASV